jgi:hypothetical protein
MQELKSRLEASGCFTGLPNPEVPARGDAAGYNVHGRTPTAHPQLCCSIDGPGFDERLNVSFSCGGCQHGIFDGCKLELAPWVNHVHRSAKVGMPCVGQKRDIAPSKDTPQVCVSGNLHLLKEIPRKTKRHGDLEYIMAKKHADPPHYTFSFKPDTTNQLRLPNRAIDLAEFFPTAESLMQLQPDERRKLVAAVLAKPPRKWNRHDFLSKLIVQQIVSKELGKHSVRAILKNETVRSDLMLTYHSKQEHKPPRDQRQRKRPFDRQCERPSSPFQFALGLRRAATEPEYVLP